MSIILAAGAARMKLEAENYEARISELEARLAEAAKALEQAEQQLDYGQVNAAHRIIIRALEAQGGE